MAGRVPRVTDADRRRMRRQAAALDATRVDEPGSAARRRSFQTLANWLRQRAGRPPLPDEEEEPPEREFYRRARSLGMVGTGRRTPR